MKQARLNTNTYKYVFRLLARIRIFILLAVIAVFISACDAQKRELDAINSEVHKGNIIEAKERIDAAIEGEAAENPYAWIVTSNVYMEIFASEDPYVKELHQDPLGYAHQALKKAKELDVNRQHFLLIQQNELLLSQLLHEAGAVSYNEGRFPLASSYFRLSYDVSKGFNVIDTLTLFYAAYSAERGMMYNDAEKYLLELIDLNYDDIGVYTSLINVYAALDKHDEVVKWIENAKAVNPDDVDISIIFAEANYYLRSGNTEGAERAISEAIKKEPNNPNLYFALGANYERIYNDTTYTLKDREDAFTKAVEAYKSSLEIEPDQFDVIYSIGALYFNRGIAIYEEADAILRVDMDFNAYKKRETKFKEMWLQAQPYLENAKMLIEEDNVNFEVVVSSLTELYARTNQTEKLERMQEIRKRLGYELDE